MMTTVQGWLYDAAGDKTNGSVTVGRLSYPQHEPEGTIVEDHGKVRATVDAAWTVDIPEGHTYLFTLRPDNGTKQVLRVVLPESDAGGTVWITDRLSEDDLTPEEQSAFDLHLLDHPTGVPDATGQVAGLAPLTDGAGAYALGDVLTPAEAEAAYDTSAEVQAKADAAQGHAVQRTNHTGTQAQGTVEGLVADLDARITTADAADTYGTAADRFVDLADYGPFGDGTDGTDDTTEVQAALTAAAGRILLWRGKATPYRVGPLDVPGRIAVVVEPGTVVRAITGLGAEDRLVNVEGVSGVSIVGYGATFEGTGDYVGGEQRHIFHVRGATDVLLAGMAANDSGGDGFYVGGESGGLAYSEDVTLRDITADGNRRQGISVTSARNLLLEHPRCTGTLGTSPAAGIDLEPNATTEVLAGVRVVAPYTSGNDGPGVLVALNALDATSEPVDIEIIGHHSHDDENGFRAVGQTTPPGRVSWEGTVMTSRAVGVRVNDWLADGPQLVVRPTVLNPGADNPNSVTLDSGIVIQRDSGSPVLGTLGNIRIVEPTIIDDRAVSQMTRYVWVQDGEGIGAENIVIDRPRRMIGARVHAVGGNSTTPMENMRLHDPDEVLARQVTGTETLTADRGTSLAWTSVDNTNTRIVTLAAVGFAGPVKFERRGATAGIRIQPHAGGQIIPLGNGVDKYIQLDEAGASVTLLRRGNDWLATSSVGDVIAQA